MYPIDYLIKLFLSYQFIVSIKTLLIEKLTYKKSLSSCFPLFFLIFVLSLVLSLLNLLKLCLLLMRYHWPLFFLPLLLMSIPIDQLQIIIFVLLTMIFLVLSNSLLHFILLFYKILMGQLLALLASRIYCLLITNIHLM